MANAPTTTRDRAIALLGQGVAPAQVASACGVTESAISQLVSDEEVAKQITELRFQNLQKFNERDSQYDSIEDKLITKLDGMIGMMFKPMEVLKSIQVINAAKRRGSSAPEHITGQQTIVNVILPAHIAQKFTVNSANQVINAGGQDLLTIQSGDLLRQVKGDSGELTQAGVSSGYIEHKSL